MAPEPVIEKPAIVTPPKIETPVQVAPKIEAAAPPKIEVIKPAIVPEAPKPVAPKIVAPPKPTIVAPPPVVEAPKEVVAPEPSAPAEPGADVPKVVTKAEEEKKIVANTKKALKIIKSLTLEPAEKVKAIETAAEKKEEARTEKFLQDTACF